MSVIIRETFIGLHSSNVLQRLSDEFKERYKGYKISLASIATLLPKLPALGKVMQVEEGKEASEVSGLIGHPTRSYGRFPHRGRTFRSAWETR